MHADNFPLFRDPDSITELMMHITGKLEETRGIYLTPTGSLVALDPAMFEHVARTQTPMDEYLREHVDPLFV